MKGAAFLLFFALASFPAWSQPWVIGLNADLSSVAKEGGEAIAQGMGIAIDEINANGGLLGEMLTLEARDHRGNPARGIANIKSLAKDERLLAIVGGVHTPVAIAELPIIHELPVVYLDPWAAGTPIIENGFDPNFAFRLSVRDEWAGAVILEAAKNDQCPGITLLLERTGWGRSNESSMSIAAETLELPIDSIEWFNWNSTILEPLIIKLSQNNVRCIALVANTPEGVDIVKAVANLPEDNRPNIYSHWGITGGNFTEQIGLGNLKKVNLKYLQTLSYVSPKTAVGENLVKSFEQKYGKMDGNNAFNGVAHAYDLVHLLARAVEKAGSADPIAIQQALENLGAFDGAMKFYQQPFNKNRHEALDASDYLMLQFSNQGYGVTQ